MTHLVVPLTASDPAAMRRDFAAAVAQGATMIEVRLDHLSDPQAPLFEPPARVPIIVTNRPVWEGGKCELPEPQRRARLMQAAQALGAEWIDFEFNAWRREPLPDWDRLRRRVILSYHDFSKTPHDLPAIVDAMGELGAAKVKVACKAQSTADAVRVLDVLAGSPRPHNLIALAMDEPGLITRLLAGKFGAFLTFAALSDGAQSAPGQPTVRQMREAFAWDRIRSTTATYGVIGCPVSHSKSPKLHNAAFAAVGLDNAYVRLRVEPGYESFAEAMDALTGLPALDFRGGSITIPHKENALRWVLSRGGTVDELSRRIGAVNTLARSADGSWIARNTDCPAAVDAVCAAGGWSRADLAGKSVLVLGAGGAARAMVVGFADGGCRVTLCNRTFDKAQSLSRELGCAAVAWEDRGSQVSDILVNTTSVGMTPKVDESPMPAGSLNARTLVFDSVYNPPMTRLLKEAVAAGCRIAEGSQMFVNQAVGQFELWTGVPAPRDVMDAARMKDEG